MSSRITSYTALFFHCACFKFTALGIAIAPSHGALIRELERKIDLIGCLFVYFIQVYEVILSIILRFGRRDDATSSFWWRRLGLQIFRSQGNQRYDFYHPFSESSLKSGFDMCCSVLWQKLIGRFDSSYIQAHGDAPLQYISEYCSYAAPMLESNYKSRRVSFVRL